MLFTPEEAAAAAEPIDPVIAEAAREILAALADGRGTDVNDLLDAMEDEGKLDESQCERVLVAVDELIAKAFPGEDREDPPTGITITAKEASDVLAAIAELEQREGQAPLDLEGPVAGEPPAEIEEEDEEAVETAEQAQ